MDKFLELFLRSLYFLAKGVIVVMLLAILGYGVIFWRYKNDLPDRQTIENMSFNQTSIIYDRTGEHILYEVHGDENRTTLPHDEIPDIIREAIISAEDDAFYSHHGIDIPGILRALKANLQGQTISQGASTITQQLARNIFLTREKTYDRKIREIILAMRIETIFSKDEILDLYLNGVSFGSNTYGIESAAQRFFGKSARDLSLDQAALLAALPKATSYYSPYGSHKDDLLERRDWILNKLKDKNIINVDQLKTALADDTLQKIITPTDKIEAPHFVFYLLDKIEEKYGKEKIEEGGLKIISSLNYALQKKAEEMVKNYALKDLKKFRAENAAAVVIDNKTGEILAMVGSRDFFDASIDGEVNVATSSRQPGSSIKPIVYASAFEKGYQPETMLWDVKTSFGPDGTGGEYVPANYNGEYSGMVSMRQALARSLNVPAVKTLYLSGIDNFLETAQNLGIESVEKLKNYGLSLGLGAGNLTLLELTNAYGILANDGNYFKVTPIAEINDKLGNSIHQSLENNQSIISSETARKISSILSDNEARSAVFGTNSKLVIPEKTVAVKTGTTQDYRDAWTVGYTPDISVGVWTGNNNYSPMQGGAAGIYAAAPLWNELMSLAIQDKEGKSFSEYEKVESDNLMVTGKLETTVEYYNEKTGEKLSEKDLRKTKSSKVREKIVPAQHSILYYIDKEHPLESYTPEENRTDFMLSLWEEAIINPDWDKKEEEK